MKLPICEIMSMKYLRVAPSASAVMTFGFDVLYKLLEWRLLNLRFFLDLTAPVLFQITHQNA
jgi:hypothetical protein